MDKKIIIIGIVGVIGIITIASVVVYQFLQQQDDRQKVKEAARLATMTPAERIEENYQSCESSGLEATMKNDDWCEEGKKLERQSYDAMESFNRTMEETDKTLDAVIRSFD